jgi:hypothetical protein
MTAFKELLIGGYVLRFWPSDNGWMCGITPQMMDALGANEFNPDWDTQAVLVEEIQRMAKRIEELEAKDEPYALEASMFSNDRVKVDPVTGNVSIGTPQQEAKDEPVAWRAWVSKFPQGTGSDWVYVTKPIMKDSVHNQPLYTTPPQRTWVGLTDEEIVLIVAECAASHQHTDIHFARAIEAKLKEKNT